MTLRLVYSRWFLLDTVMSRHSFGSVLAGSLRRSSSLKTQKNEDPDRWHRHKCWRTDYTPYHGDNSGGYPHSTLPRNKKNKSLF